MQKMSKLFRVLAIALTICMMMQINITAPVGAAENSPTVYDLQCDYTVNPLGIDNPLPVLSWKLQSNSRGLMQEAYQIFVSSTSEKLSAGDYDVWNSGKKNTNESVGIEYKGPPLVSSRRYFWKVKVWDNSANAIESTESAWFETGLLKPQDWSANWIELSPTFAAATKYSIDFDFRIVKDDMGFVFAAKDSETLLMWQINTFDKKFAPKMSFHPHEWKNGGRTIIEKEVSEQIMPMADYFKKHHMRIEIDKTVLTASVITTYLNGLMLEAPIVRDLTGFGERLGFRQITNAGDCDEKATFDNIRVTAQDGTVLFFEDFSGVSHSFNCGVVEDGELFVEKADRVIQSATTASAPMYRKAFSVDKTVKSARVYASALGIYELEINGEKISEDFFNPGWTAYELNPTGKNYVMYQTFDVTDLLKNGDNVIGGMTGHGWYSGKLFVGGTDRYGTGSKLLCQLEITYTDGSKKIVATDNTWKVSGHGPIIADDFQGGESYDARREMDGWSKPDYIENASWGVPTIGSYGGDVIAQIGPTVRAIEEIKPIAMSEPVPGTYIFNLGQNISGFARINVRGASGQTVKLRFGEMLQANGNLYTENLRSAQATDYYTLKGDTTGEIYQPRFTFHGYQYIEVTGFPGVPTIDDITGIALSSLQTTTGTFETSNEDINKLQSNIVWGQKDNFISVPTDCPQRDERLGYTGDGQVFARTAVMNMDVSQFFKKFMKDITSNQRSDGRICDWAPNYVTGGDSMSGSFGRSGWGDAVVIIPWTMYTTYADKSAITDNYDAMKKWINYYVGIGGGSLVVTTDTFGDWLNINADTPKDVISTAYFAYCVDLFSKMAKAIGNDTDATYYEQLFLNIRTAFNDSFVTAQGKIKGDTQTSYLLALKFNLLPTQELKETAAQHLVANITARDGHLSTGFLGVAYLCPILTEMGYEDVAYELIMKETYPSWLYSVKNGATTIWERWNSYIAETGEFASTGMNSFNHYSLGSIGEWFYNYVGGIQYDEQSTAYKHIIIQPTPGGDLTFVNSSFKSAYGNIISNWKYENADDFVLNVTIPANTTATVHLPAISLAKVTEGGVSLANVQGITSAKLDKDKAVIELGSGNYVFKSTLPNAEAEKLLEHISEALQLKINAVIGTDSGNYSQGAVDKFAQNITAAQLVARDSTATIAEVSSAVRELRAAISAFKNAAWSKALLNLTAESALRIKAADWYSASSMIGTQACEDVGGGLNPTYTEVGQWLEYDLAVADGGTYKLTSRVSVNAAGAAWSVLIDDGLIQTVTQPSSTGGWQNWYTNAPVEIQIPEGVHTMKILITATGLNFNWFELEYVPDTSVSVASVEAAINALPDVYNVKLSDETAILSANTDFFKLKLSERLLVQNSAKLTDLVRDIAVLKAPANGDINADGRENIADILMMRRHILTAQALTAAQKHSGDITGDSDITLLDIMALRNIILRI